MSNVEAMLIREVEKHASTLPSAPIIILNGAEVIERYNKKLDRQIKIYNRRLEKLSSPYFIRDRHKVGEYEYHGRYFYKYVWDEKSGRMREKYIGLTVPDDDDVPEGGFPPTPINKLEGFKYRVLHHDIICSEQIYNKFFRFFLNKDVTVLKIAI